MRIVALEFTVKTARGDCPYVGVPVFLSRAFRHTAIVIRTDRGIAGPTDLKGRRIGLPEYQLTACVWARAILADDYGVRPADIVWVRGGLEEAGRPEKIAFTPPPNLRIEEAPEGESLTAMLEAGTIDGIMAPRAPFSFVHFAANIGWLFSDPNWGCEGLLPADWYFSDHAYRRGAQGVDRAASLACRRCAESVR